MADVAPLTFNDPAHGVAIASAKQTADAALVDLERVRAIVDQRVAFWQARARGNPKCGADLMALQACRAVLSLIAGKLAHEGDALAWLAVTERRGLAAIDSESTVSLRAPVRSLLASDHPYLLAACRLLRGEGLFRADAATKSARRRAQAKKSPKMGRKAA
jgi:hypothetical protein